MTAELKRYNVLYGVMVDRPQGEYVRYKDAAAALDEIKRQAWNDTLEAAAQKVESLWAFRTCREVADAIRDMKKDS